MDGDGEDRALELITRSTLITPRQRSEVVHVDCLRQDRLVPIRDCDGCGRRHGARHEAGSGKPTVLCELPRRRFDGDDERTPISALVPSRVDCVTPEVSAEAAAGLLAEQRLEVVSVVDDEGRPVGELSRAAAFGASPGQQVRDRMRWSSAQLQDQTTVAEASRQMVEHALHRMPVVASDGELVGVVSSLDVLGFVTGQRKPRVVASSPGNGVVVAIGPQVKHGSAPPQTVRLRWRGLEVDVARHRVLVDGAPLRLRRMEYRILMLLLQQPGRLLTRSFIIRELWGGREDVAARTVDTHVRRLRQALGPYGALVETSHGFGYRLGEP
jgi:CBS domain-containing protein